MPKKLLKIDLSIIKKVFLSHLVRLSSGKFGRDHGYSINLSNAQIANWCSGAFSVRQVQRHIDALADAGLIEVSFVRGVRWICVRSVASAKQKMPLVSVLNKKLSKAQEALLSLLLDKAAFRARGGLNFSVGRLRISTLADELYPLSVKTVQNAVKKLQAENLISCVPGEKGQLLSIAFAPDLEWSYSEFIKLKTSVKCRKIVHDRAVQVVLNQAEDSLVSKLREENEQRKRRRSGMAEQPCLFAEGCAAAAQQPDSAQLWRAALNSLGLNCSEQQRSYQLTAEQTNTLLSGEFPTFCSLLEKKDTSHRGAAEKNDISHMENWKKMTQPTGANPHSNAVFGPSINNKYINSLSELTHRAGAVGKEQYSSFSDLSTKNLTNLRRAQ